MWGLYAVMSQWCHQSFHYSYLFLCSDVFNEALLYMFSFHFILLFGVYSSHFPYPVRFCCGWISQIVANINVCLLSLALFYQSTLLARPLVVPHKCQEQPYMLTARIHASQALNGQYQQVDVCSSWTCSGGNVKCWIALVSDVIQKEMKPFQKLPQIQLPWFCTSWESPSTQGN